jgi:hypothetical protein
MNFVDNTIVALADETTRKGVFDSTALGQILEAAYDVNVMGPFQGQFEPLFDTFELGFSAAPLATLDGTWNLVGGVERTEARLRLSGIGSDTPRIDAVWRGAILARFATAAEHVEAVSVAWPDRDGVDATVAAAHGGVLPTGAALESERRTTLLTQIRASLHAPAAFIDEDLDGLLEGAGVATVKELFERFQDPEHAAAVQLTYSQPVAVSTTRKPLPISAILLVRASPISVAGLLAETKAVRARLQALGVEVPPDPTLRARQTLVVIWVVPASVFDDTDWPGASASVRRDNAGVWLAREGIGLVAVP